MLEHLLKLIYTLVSLCSPTGSNLLLLRPACGGSFSSPREQHSAAGSEGAAQQRCGRGPGVWRLPPQRCGHAAQDVPGRAAGASAHTQALPRSSEDRRWERILVK